MNEGNNENSLIKWLEEQQAASNMDAKQIPLSQVGEPWGMQPDAFKRTDGKFFELTGAQITMSGREVKTWNQPMLKETGPQGVVALVIENINNRLLVTARQEPGNKAPGRVLLGPSFQASIANLQQVHGGKKPPLAEILDMPEAEILSQADQPLDGSRYFEKQDNIRVVAVPNEASVQHLKTENQKWAEWKELEEAISKGLCNPYLRDAYLALLLSALRA